jgi:MarR family transcriptional regulator, 2-MHQ and catechol-resistance regulon repressor
MSRKCTNLPFLVLMQTSKGIQESLRLEMSKNNLSITEFSVLEVLYHKGKQNIQQIGQSILISSGSMTYVIDRLEKKGLIFRSACPDDRRAIHVALTDDGNNFMKDIMPKHHQWVENVFSSLNTEESEIFVNLLKKVRKKI